MGCTKPNPNFRGSRRSFWVNFLIKDFSSFRKRTIKIRIIEEILLHWFNVYYSALDVSNPNWVWVQYLVDKCSARQWLKITQAVAIIYQVGQNWQKGSVALYYVGGQNCPIFLGPLQQFRAGIKIWRPSRIYHIPALCGRPSWCWWRRCWTMLAPKKMVRMTIDRTRDGTAVAYGISDL